jgi:hypothetical protein
MTDYTAIDALNWSSLKLLATSPKLYHFRLDNPAPDKASFSLGRAIHCAVLEPERWRSEYIVRPDFGDGRTKAAKEAKSEWLATIPEGVTELDAPTHALAEICAESVFSHRVARELLRGGCAEEIVQWSDPETGIACKLRADYLRPDLLVDLKSTQDPSPAAFVREVPRYLYHGQLGMYSAGCIAAGRLPPDAAPPHIIAVQSREPYDVACYQLSPGTLAAGRALFRRLITLYQRCTLAGYWPGCAPELVELELPPWAIESEIPDDSATVEDW